MGRPFTLTAVVGGSVGEAEWSAQPASQGFTTRYGEVVSGLVGMGSSLDVP